MGTKQGSLEGVERLMYDSDFYNGRKILVTGHTGFKGSWLCRMLINAGADVTGYALEPPTDPNLFSIADIENNMNSVIGDVRDYEKLEKVFETVKPEIVIHLAAQPIVREGYKNPVYTYETNVMGTVNVLECARNTQEVKSILNVTTDKVYRNNECRRGYCESEFLDGFDPYSNSKSCSELVTHSYDRCFFKSSGISVSTARAGNVIGGGDFAKDRIIPDCIRSVRNNRPIIVRNPHSVRPYQHVLEPLAVYLMIAQKQYEDINFAGAYNIGPDDGDCITTGELADLFCKYWGHGADWKSCVESNAPHEANFLKLDCTKIKETFNWKPKWNIEKSIEMICRFSKKLINNENIPNEMDYEIKEFLEGKNAGLEK